MTEPGWELNDRPPWLRTFLADSLSAAGERLDLPDGARLTYDTTPAPVYKVGAQITVSHEMAVDAGWHDCDPSCPQWTPPVPPARLTRRARLRHLRWRVWWTVRHLHEYRIVHRSDLEQEGRE